MPKYFFDLVGERSFLKDRMGMELPDDAAAYREAHARGTNGISLGSEDYAGYNTLIVRSTQSGIVAAIPIPRKQR